MIRIQISPTGQPSYLHSLLSVTINRFVLSSSPITLNHPPNSSCLEITAKSFCHSAPALWNTLPPHLHQLSHHYTPFQPISNSPVSALF